MICFAWAGFPQYAARCVGAFVKATDEKVVVIATRPGVPIRGMEDACGCPVKWVEGQSTGWLDELQELPRVLFVSGWIDSGFNALRERVKANGGRVVCCNDANYVFSFREILRAIRFRISLRKKFDAFFVPGKSGRKLMRFYGVPDRLIFEGLYSADASLFHDGLPVPERSKKIIFVGQICGRKNVLRLCEAFQASKIAARGWTLDLYGSGPLEARLREQLAREKNPGIALHPFLQPAELAEKYREARAFILPSVDEHWGLVVHEAALSGCVLLLSDCIGAADDFLTKRNGLSFDPQSVVAIAETIRQLAAWRDEQFVDAQSASLEKARSASLDRFVKGARECLGGFAYVLTGWVGRYSKNANAYQKVVLTADVLNGRLLVPQSAQSSFEPRFQSALLALPLTCRNLITQISYYWRAVRATRGLFDNYCFSPSNEVMFLAVILVALFTRQKYWLFIWDPPGVSLWNRTSLLARLRQFVMSALFAGAAQGSKGVVLNLHPGFLERRFLRSVKGKFISFVNGTCVEANRSECGNREPVPYRIAVNGAFTQDKGVDDIIHIFCDLWKRDPKYSLVWVGYGGDVERVRIAFRNQGVPDRQVELLPGASHAEAMMALGTASIALNAYHDVPSLRWNFVLKIPEFLSLRIPIVSLQMPGVSAYLPYGDIRVLSSLDCAASIIEGMMSELGSSKEDRRWMRPSGRDYDWRQINSAIATVMTAKMQ